MQRSVILIITIVIVVVLVTSLLVFIEVSKQPHRAFISERTAEEISGQNYTLSSQTTTTGIALPYGPYGEKLVQGVLYRNEPQFTTNGSFSNYYFQDAVMEFNNTTMAQTVYQLESGFLEHGNIGTIYPTANGT